ncbi:MAG: hypothetical protein PVH19_14230 [Planctomycetia bacterium]|jgi:hypothetical protein
MMDPFRICLALGPLAIYLLGVSAINLRRRPTLLSGSSDTAGVGLAIIGLVIIGPMELFMPDAAAARFGPAAWLFMILLYTMILVLTLLALRLRLVIYNISHNELRVILGDVAERLDPEGARWAGDSLSIPKLGIQLYLDTTAMFRNVSLVAGSPHQNPMGWKYLEKELRQSLKTVQVHPNHRAIGLLAAGLILSVIVLTIIVINPAKLYASAVQMFMI